MAFQTESTTRTLTDAEKNVLNKIDGLSNHLSNQVYMILKQDQEHPVKPVVEFSIFLIKTYLDDIDKLYKNL